VSVYYVEASYNNTEEVIILIKGVSSDFQFLKVSWAESHARRDWVSRFRHDETSLQEVPPYPGAIKTLIGEYGSDYAIYSIRPMEPFVISDAPNPCE
jgi:hypothetical protein